MKPIRPPRPVGSVCLILLGYILLNHTLPVGRLDLLFDPLGFALLLAGVFGRPRGARPPDRGAARARWLVLLIAPGTGLWGPRAEAGLGMPPGYFIPFALWAVGSWAVARWAFHLVREAGDPRSERLLRVGERGLARYALVVAASVAFFQVVVRALDPGLLTRVGLHDVPGWAIWAFRKGPFVCLEALLAVVVVGLVRRDRRAAGVRLPQKRPARADAPAAARFRWGPFAAVLLLSAAMNGWGLWWLLPNTAERYADPLVPGPVYTHTRTPTPSLNANVYPPLQYDFVGAAMATARRALRLVRPDASYTETAAWLMSAARGVSAVMGVCLVGLVYVLTWRLVGSALGAVAASFVMAVNPVVILRAHMTNPDVAYTMWLTASLAAAFRVLRRDRATDWIWLGLTAGLAVTTKDQAAMALAGVAVVVLAAARGRARQADAGSGRRVGGVPAGAGLALLAFAYTFASIHGLLRDGTWFVEHVRAITVGPNMAGRGQTAATPGGYASLAVMATGNWLNMVTVPVTLLILSGVALAVVRRRAVGRAAWILAPVLTYLAGLAVVRRVWMRHWIPVLAMLSVFVGLAADRSWRVRRWRVVTAPAAVLLGLFLLWRGLVTDALLHRSSRSLATAWLEARMEPDDLLCTLQVSRYQPPLPAVGRHVFLAEPTPERLADLSPDYVVAVSQLFDRYVERADPRAGDEAPRWRRREVSRIADAPEAARFYDDLMNGRLGYVRAAWLKVRLPLTPRCFWQLNPDVVIMRRAGDRPTDRPTSRSATLEEPP